MLEGVLRLDGLVLSSPTRTPEGFLKVPATVTRAGIFEYRLPSGAMRRELRRPEQVFKAESMASLQGVPFIHRHPSLLRHDGLVTAKNSRELMRGYTGTVAYKEGQSLGVDVVITDEQTIQAAERGEVQLSAGYVCRMDEKPGTWTSPEGVAERYDAEQMDIRYNHVALVKKARAGNEARLRLDSELNLITDEEHHMFKIKLDDGREVEVSEDVFKAHQKAEKLRLDAEGALATKNRELETVKGDRDALKVKLDGQETDGAKKEEAERVKKAVAARTTLLGQARAILPAEKAAALKLDDMDDADIMKAVIQGAAAEGTEVKLDDATEDYLRGRFESVVVLHASKIAKPKPTSKIGAQLHEARTGTEVRTDGMDQGGREVTPAQLKEIRRKKLTERWKSPLSKAA